MPDCDPGIYKRFCCCSVRCFSNGGEKHLAILFFSRATATEAAALGKVISSLLWKSHDRGRKGDPLASAAGSQTPSGAGGNPPGRGACQSPPPRPAARGLPSAPSGRQERPANGNGPLTAAGPRAPPLRAPRRREGPWPRPSAWSRGCWGGCASPWQRRRGAGRGSDELLCSAHPVE